MTDLSPTPGPGRSLTLPGRLTHRPLWLTIAAVGGTAWNAYGLVQFAGSLGATPESLIAQGLSAEQAAVMTGYPGWMTLAFAVGVISGLVGSVLLALRLALARRVLALSVAAYVALWIGDAVHGVFAAMGAPQVVILTLVVAIAAGLLAASRHPAARL
jgi:hypothetical protein